MKTSRLSAIGAMNRRSVLRGLRRVGLMIGLAVIVLGIAAVSPAGQDPSSGAPPPDRPAAPSAASAPRPKPAPSVEYVLVNRETVDQRLREAPRKNDEREPALESMFAEAGCQGGNLTEQPVKHERFPNVICRLPGSLDSTIIVGAHFDKVARGGGVVDNWSGASVLTSLFQSLHDRPRRHTFLFIGFTAEEQGLVGSKYYVSRMTPGDVARTRAMVNIDTLALGPTNIWLTHSDRRLANAFYGVAQSMKLPLAVVNADGVGDDDSHSFMRLKIPTLMVHSITSPTFRILHSDSDNLSAVRFGDYYDSYRLIAAYLAWIDAQLD
jgi:hypothetical protein